jgi:hypothetical protein
MAKLIFHCWIFSKFIKRLQAVMSCRGHLLRKQQLTIDPGTFDSLARQLVESSLLLQCPSEEKLEVPGFQFDEGKSWNHMEDHGG